MPDAPQGNPEDKKNDPKASEIQLNLPQTPFPMKANLPDNEPGRLAAWQQQHLYAQIRAARAGAAKYILHDGPPYANGAIHLGHALNKCIKDFVVKTKTMAGFDAPYVPGWDCHGLPIEIKVDEQLAAKTRDGSPRRPPRLPRVRPKIRRPSAHPVRAHRRLRPLGQSLSTMSNGYEASIAETFYDFFEKDFVYKGLRPVYWCIHDKHRARRSRSRIRAAHQPQRLRPLQTHQRPARWFTLGLQENPSPRSSGPPPPGPSPHRRPSRSTLSSNTSPSKPLTAHTSSPKLSSPPSSPTAI